MHCRSCEESRTPIQPRSFSEALQAGNEPRARYGQDAPRTRGRRCAKGRRRRAVGYAPPFPTVLPNVGVVEAFPNAFLGVALDDGIYERAQQIQRGGKFDWLYDRWADLGLFQQAVTDCGLPLETVDRLARERDHDKRAALVCLLTAAFALTGRAAFVGDSNGGYFALPPYDLWANCARRAFTDMEDQPR
jgi:hypothetical protein